MSDNSCLAADQRGATCSAACLVVLAGLGFVCLVTAIFVVLARFFARKVLSDDDGSSLP